MMEPGKMEPGKMEGGAMDKGKMGGAMMEPGKMEGGAMDKGKMVRNSQVTIVAIASEPPSVEKENPVRFDRSN